VKCVKYSINNNSVLLFESHKYKPRPNNVILTIVTAVTSAKHSDRDTESVCFVRLSKLYITWSVMTSQVARYCLELPNKQHKRKMRAVLTVGSLRWISERDVTKLITKHLWFFTEFCPPIRHRLHTVFARINELYYVVMSRWTVQILNNPSV
jgi:hypothetical protein